MIGEELTEPGLLVVFVVMLETLLCSDDEEGRRPGRETGVCVEGEKGEYIGCDSVDRDGVASGSSSSACSEIVSEIFNELRLKVRMSSAARNGLCLRIDCSRGLGGLAKLGG